MIKTMECLYNRFFQTYLKRFDSWNIKQKELLLISDASSPINWQLPTDLFFSIWNYAN